MAKIGFDTKRKLAEYLPTLTTPNNNQDVNLDLMAETLLRLKIEKKAMELVLAYLHNPCNSISYFTVQLEDLRKHLLFVKTIN